MMRLDLNPMLRQELANLDKDADSRKSAMKALKSYVKDLDSKAIPVFLAQVSETKETSCLSGEYTISLYEILARVHGPNIVPQIDLIMSTIIKTLASSAGSFPLQQACSKVVPAIARYGIDPTTPDDRKRKIVHSLCRPLSDSLLGSQESLTSGAALCLKALVDCDNWRYASDDMVNKVCQNVTASLESNCNQTHLLMGLVMALTKHNPLIVEAYARLLIHFGIKILGLGVSEGHLQKRLSAVQMLNFLMQFLDPRSICSEVDLIIKEMDKCQSDQMAYVRGAAYEAKMTATRIAVEMESKFDKGSRSVTGSNFSKKTSNPMRNCCGGNDHSHVCRSPESQTLDSFSGYDFDSPTSVVHGSCNSEDDRRSVNRKHWSRANGGVDVSLKDGLFSAMSQGSPMSAHRTASYNMSENDDHTEEFEGFQLPRPRNCSMRSITPTPQRQCSCLDLDGIKIYRTPRKLIRSLQDSDDMNSDNSDEQDPGVRTPDQNGFVPNSINKVTENGNLFHRGSNLSGSASESVSSADNAPIHVNMVTNHNVVSSRMPENQQMQTVVMKEKKNMGLVKSILGLIPILLLVFVSLLWMDGQDEIQHYPVPT